MSRTKIDFGIDLGTTNSAIAVMDNGKIRIIKSDRYQKDTTPSCVQFTRKQQVRVGDAAVTGYQKEISTQIVGSEPNSFVEFKRTMGTDKKYASSYMNRSYSSEELSSEIIKKLRSYEKDGDVISAVVTVPNQFRQNQIDATQRATELAGLRHCELLQEPIAASMAYGIESESMQGFWVVFDFGGGTFDTALMKVDEGIMKVVDTDGDNHLGGKDLDIAIVDQIFLPWLKENYAVEEILNDAQRGTKLRAELKRAAEEIKILLSSATEATWMPDEPIGEDSDGEDIDPEIKVTLKQFETAVGPIFDKALGITKGLLARNNVSVADLASILLVGGPTLSQTLRQSLRDEFGDLINTSVDPMTSVARGAALFASTKTIPGELQQRDRAKVQLSLKYPETTVEVEESLGIRVEREQSDASTPSSMWIEVSRSDGGWASGKVMIEDVEIIELHLVQGKTNSFAITLSDEKGNTLPSEPGQFNVIQGLTAAKATLPHAICVESFIVGTGSQRLAPLEGLEKNVSLPAKGKGSFKTQQAIRPGNTEDILKIPLIEGNPGERAIYNQPAGIINCSGEDLSEFLPEGSEVELTVEVDASRRIKLSAYFPYIDETYEKFVADVHDTEQTEYDASMLRQEILKAQHSLNLLDTSTTDQLDTQLASLIQRLDENGDDYDSKVFVFEHLQNVLKEIDKLEANAEWPNAEQRLSEALEHLALTNEQYGNAESAAIISQLEANASAVRQKKDAKIANELIDQIGAVQFSLIRNETGLWIGYVKGFDDDFDSHEWSNPSQARNLINQAKQIIATQPSRDKLEAIVFGLFELLPDKEMPITGESDRELLLK